MKFFQKLGKVLANNIACTIALVVAIVCFFYFSTDLIAGIFTVASAFIMYICVDMLYQAYKKTPAGSTKKSAKKK